MQSAQASSSHDQLRELYLSLLLNQENFDEFKQMLACYPQLEGDLETSEAAEIRAALNERLSEWVDDFRGLSAKQVLLWRAIVVEERINVTLSPWKESNLY